MDKELILEDLKKEGYSLITMDGERWLMSKNYKTKYVIDDSDIQYLKQKGLLSIVEQTRTFKAVLKN